MPRYTPDEIIKLVEEKKNLQSIQDVHNRMDVDYSLWRLDTYEGDQALDGFRIYTTNEPRTYANKVMALLSSAILILRAERGARDKEERKSSNAKERFLYGILKAADERLLRLLLPSLHAQLTWYVPLRGRYVVRALLAKRDDGTTFVDITPFDPYHVYWEMGQDGVEWACHVIEKTPAEIKAIYNVEVSAGTGQDGTVTVYDFYDGANNQVVMEGQVLKPPTPHGSPRFPLAIGFTGIAPPVRTEKLTDPAKDYGESIYQANREAYKELSFALSGMSEFVKRSLKQPVVITSRDGSKTLAENPYLSGATISLAEGDKVEPLDLMTMAQEAGVYLGIVTGEIQRGALPHSAFGELQFALSGFAINSLRQGMTTVVEPMRRAIMEAYGQIANLICDQYVTGNFQAMELSGRDRNRDYFKEEITPEVVKAGGEVTVDLIARLPQDDIALMAMATQARQGPVPLLSDRYLREEQLGVQDSDLMDAQVMEQMAVRASPVAAAYKMMMAAAEEGEEELAQIWLGEVQKQLIQTYLELMQLQMAAAGLAQSPPSGGGNGAGNGTRPAGFSPMVLPKVAQGAPPPTPTPQMGPLVPPGAPRPGARLFGPNGLPL